MDDFKEDHAEVRFKDKEHLLTAFESWARKRAYRTPVQPTTSSTTTAAKRTMLPTCPAVPTDPGRRAPNPAHSSRRRGATR